MREKKYFRIIKKQYFLLIVVAFIASSFILMMGYNLQKNNPIVSQFLVVFGGSGLGTCFGFLLGNLVNSSSIEKIKDIIEDSFESGLFAKSSDLVFLKTEWHHYILTTIDNKKVWRYRKMDFSSCNSLNKISTLFSTIGADGRKHTYRIEGYLIPPRLIFVQKAVVGSEHTIIQVFPSFTDEFIDKKMGLAFFTTWDNNPVVSKVIIARKALALTDKKYGEGTLKESNYALLDELWQKGFKDIQL